jgi:hypothetical protein
VSKVFAFREIQDLIGKHKLGSPEPDQVEEFKKQVQIAKVQSQNGVPAVSVAVNARDSKVSQALTQDVMDRLLRALPKGAAVIDVPSLPSHPIAPRPGRILTMGTLSGFLAGALAALVRMRRVKAAQADAIS